MTVDLDNWSIDVYVSGTWVSLKADILQDPGPRWSRGIMDNGPLDRVGDSTTLMFHLRNDDLNSARLHGYYSPGHTNAMGGWTTGLPVRLWFTYEGRTFYKFYGTITSNGIIPDAGLYSKRSVAVTVQNFMAQASNHELNLLGLYTNKRIDEAVALIVGNMIVQPLATDYATGNDTFPTILDSVGSGTRALSEFQSLAMSEFGYIYDKGDQTGGETLVVESRQSRSSKANMQLPKPASETGSLMRMDGGYVKRMDGGNVLLNEYQSASFDNVNYPDSTRFSFGKNLSNRIRAITNIRKIDASATTNLYVLPSAFQMTAGQTLTVRGAYRDPNGGASYVNADPSTMTCSYTANSAEDGTGANLTSSLTVTPTYGAAEVKFEITAAVELWVTALTATGKGIYHYDPLTTIYEDAAAQSSGIFQTTFDLKYQNNPTTTDALANYTLGLEKNPNLTIDRFPILANRNGMTMFGFLYLEPGTRAYFKEDQAGVDGDYFIQGYEAEMFAGKYIVWSPVLKSASATNFWIWDTSEWNVDNVWGLPG